jgi:tellurite resistance protein TehA-like permease
MRNTDTGGVAMAATTGTSSVPGEGRGEAAVRNLPPAAFSFVMATGIISSDALVFGPQWLSKSLLVLACVGLALLTLGLVVRVVRFPSAVRQDARRPERVFGFFTIVAGVAVVGIRLAAGGHPVSTAWLAAIAAVVWVVLTYAIPANLLLTRSNDSVLGGVNGTWLLWVVGTQSLAIASAALVKAWPGQAGLLAPVSVGLWGVGLVLYLLLVSLILLRWLMVPMTPEALGPPYWILMGATAITVRAGAQILALPAHLPIRIVSGPFVGGFSFVLWAFGTWWIPLLVVLGLWRHLMQHWPLTYETALWSVVFPLGMYSAATLTFGKVAHLSFMEPIAHVMYWVAVAAWVCVALTGIWQLVRPSMSLEPAPALES